MKRRAHQQLRPAACRGWSRQGPPAKRREVPHTPRWPLGRGLCPGTDARARVFFFFRARGRLQRRCLSCRDRGHLHPRASGLPVGCAGTAGIDLGRTQISAPRSGGRLSERGLSSTQGPELPAYGMWVKLAAHAPSGTVTNSTVSQHHEGEGQGQRVRIGGRTRDRTDGASAQFPTGPICHFECCWAATRPMLPSAGGCLNRGASGRRHLRAGDVTRPEQNPARPAHRDAKGTCACRPKWSLTAPPRRASSGERRRRRCRRLVGRRPPRTNPDSAPGHRLTATSNGGPETPAAPNNTGR